MWGEQPQMRQIQSTTGELLQNHRKPAGRACGLNPTVRCALREVQNARAIREQRRAAFTEIQAPLVEYSEVRDELRGCVALVLRQVLDLREKSSVRKCCDRSELSVHDASLSRTSATSCRGFSANG